MKTRNLIKGERRAAKQHKKRYGHRATGHSVFESQRLAAKRADRIEKKRKGQSK